jgi:phosphatidylinositol glycan class O
VDALRVDFIEHMPFVSKILDSNSNRARLLGFLADSPTTTMQRIKGITSGNLPTFLEFSQNLDSKEMGEDNIIDQWKEHGKRIVFLGDDTWEKLFPGRFLRSTPMASFNTHDLHTVDNLCSKLIWKELDSAAFWDVLIVHVLGVDHAGHKFHANHPELLEKLKQMDLFIEQIYDKMNRDPELSNSMLLVLGDHGMTRDGNHGGPSAEEVSAALIALSPLPFMESRRSSRQSFKSLSSISHIKTSRSLDWVDQVDLASTLALLTSVPIPFCNLGTMIPDLVFFLFKDLEEMSKVMEANAHQIFSYLETYQLESPKTSLSSSTLAFIRQEFQRLQDLNITNQFEYIESIRSLMKSVLTLCRNQWSTFDVDSMTLGALFFSLACSAHGLCLLILHAQSNRISWNPQLNVNPADLLLGLLTGLFVLLSSQNLLYSSLMLVNIPLVSMIFRFLTRNSCLKLVRFVWISLNPETVFSVILIIVYLQGSFTDSFLVHEHQVLPYLLMTTCFVLLLKSSRNSPWLFILIPSLKILEWFGPESLTASERVDQLEVIRLTLAHFLIVLILFCLFNKSLAFFSSFSALSLWIFHAFNSNELILLWLPRLSYLSLSLFLLSCTSRKLLKKPLSCIWALCFLQLPLSLILGARFCYVFLVSLVTVSALPGDSCSHHLFLWFLGLDLFFATGHRNDLSTLQISAAFVGFKEYNFLISGSLLALNTFCGQLIHLILCIALTLKSCKKQGLFESLSLAQWLYSLRLMFSTLNALIQRNHLVVWRVFAPKFVFDLSISFVFSMLSMLCIVLYELKIDSKIKAS